MSDASQGPAVSQWQSGGQKYRIYDAGLVDGVDPERLARRPMVQKILLENLLRHTTPGSPEWESILNLANGNRSGPKESLPFYPSRVLLQDFTGVPVIVDLTSMRDAAVRASRDPHQIDSSVRMDLIIDHSVQVDSYGLTDSLQRNVEREYERNTERYAFLKWAQKAFPRLRVMPPGNGICHQVNLEYLASVVTTEDGVAYPDTLIGTDSHTTMVNGLGVLGWGVGGIEAEAVMLGEPYSVDFPEMVGVRLEGTPRPGVTATDIVLTVTRLLRKIGVVNRFVEFYGPGLAGLSVPDRATVSNMCPEYGATASFFPVDERTVSYLLATGRSANHVRLVEDYARRLGMWRDASTPSPEFDQEVVVRLDEIEPVMAGPRNPEEARSLPEIPASFREALAAYRKDHPSNGGGGHERSSDGRIAIAAITSCTNTSNPSVMVAAGLLARRALELGLRVDPFVKTSLAPGSKVVTAYLERAKLLEPLARLGFAVVGYGCTTCIGNSGPLSPHAAQAVEQQDAYLVAVLSGNRNFEARVHNQVRANYLASPPLVVAAALAGRIDIDLSRDPIGIGSEGKPVFLKDIWPRDEDIRTHLEGAMTTDMFAKTYVESYSGGALWEKLHLPEGPTYPWKPDSTYLQEVPFFSRPRPIEVAAGGTLFDNARALALLGDNVSTDHISPAGEIPKDSPAGRYLTDHGVPFTEFNTYGARRGNFEVMVRGTFANTRLRNYLVEGKDGGWSRHLPEGPVESIFDVSQKYLREGTPLIVLAGKRYGQGSSRDWAAKGPLLLGVRAVIAESYERIHRSNLAGMGILPLQFADGQSWKSLGLTGTERFTLRLPQDHLTVGAEVQVLATGNGPEKRFPVRLRLNSAVELEYARYGGVLPYALGKKLSSEKANVA